MSESEEASLELLIPNPCLTRTCGAPQRYLNFSRSVADTVAGNGEGKRKDGPHHWGLFVSGRIIGRQKCRAVCSFFA